MCGEGGRTSGPEKGDGPESTAAVSASVCGGGDGEGNEGVDEFGFDEVGGDVGVRQGIGNEGQGIVGPGIGIEMEVRRYIPRLSTTEASVIL